MSLLLSLTWSLFALSTPVLAAPATVQITPNLVRDLATINALKSHITSDPHHITKNWTGSNICAFKGIYCMKKLGSSELAVASIDFNNYNFGGPSLLLTGFLEKLKDLSLFHIMGNGFTGEFPDLSGSADYLEEIDVTNNKFHGRFPQTILDLDLTYLGLRFNQFSGPIPDQIYTNMPNLEALQLNNNQFTGPISQHIGSSQVTELSLGNNKLTGPIPPSLANAPYLEAVTVHNCSLTGTIPKELGSAKLLTDFDASGNQLTGGVPEELCARKMTSFTVNDNFLTIPLGPKCQALAAKKILDISGNCIPGAPKQRPAAECKGH
ncbi:hypothetical protein WAI453_008988 [Rhynchosporium graminicola]